MNFLKKINTKAKAEINTGFGSNASNYGGRFINKDGSPNVEKRGVGYFERISWYHTMLDMSNLKFISVLLAFYIAINFVFASVYFFNGIENLNGIEGNSFLEKFGGAYFFSAQTFTTVGYGHISPNGFLTSAIAAFEALIGLLSFAIATGLFYARFSKPKAHLLFSSNALIAPFNGATALMMRIAPHKNTSFTDAEAKVTLGLTVTENGQTSNKFFTLDLEYSKINSLTLSWTLVHPITEESPLFGISKEDFENTSGEIIIAIKTFDDMFSTTVAARSSYTFEEVVYGAKFNPMFSRDEKRNMTVLNLDKLNEYQMMELY
jgi:inward rectifier potassium channel